MTPSYEYDRIGNITYKSDVGSYSYTYSSKPHAVRSAGNISLQYDDNGNMTRRAVSGGITLDITYNYDNKPELVKRNGTNYIGYYYDGNGRRVGKLNYQTGAITAYFGELYEVRGTATIIHVFAGSQRVASLRSDGKNQFYHPNHLGSASVVTDGSGGLKERIEYYPFGTYRERPDYDAQFPNVNYTFTGQEDDDELGLYNYNARLYDPVLGRFMSADSMVPEPFNLQQLNRYSYALNNPLIYIDPSGNFSIGKFFKSFFSALAAAVTAVVVFAATVSYLGPGAFVAAGAAAGAVGSATYTALSGGNITDILQAAGRGAAYGAAGGGLVALGGLVAVGGMLIAGGVQAYRSEGWDGLAYFGASIAGSIVGAYVGQVGMAWLEGPTRTITTSSTTSYDWEPRTTPSLTNGKVLIDCEIQLANFSWTTPDPYEMYDKGPYCEGAWISKGQDIYGFPSEHGIIPFPGNRIPNCRQFWTCVDCRGNDLYIWKNFRSLPSTAGRIIYNMYNEPLCAAPWPGPQRGCW